VLEGLEQLGIRPAVVVGVSMGAVVGATYALRPDWSPALRAEDWQRLPVVNEAVEGDALERLSGYVRSARRLAPAVTKWIWRRGFGESARDTLVDLLGEEPRFADTRLPFAAVATDLRAGRRAVLAEGPLVEAVLASASIPGLAAPVDLEGAALIDGGFADPAPIDIAHSLGADVVIACHVGLPPLDERGDNWMSVLLQAVEAGQRNFAEARFRHADLVLRPDFTARVRMLDFSGVQDLIDAGRTCVESSADELATLAAGSLTR
jgi:NTE family protein